MDHGTSRRLGLRHRLAPGLSLAARRQADAGPVLGRVRARSAMARQHGLHDVDTSHDLARQAREAFSREHHERMRRYGR